MTSARTGCADDPPPATPVVVASIRQVQGKRGPAWEVRWRDLDGIHRSQTEHTEDAARDLCRLVEAEVADSKARARAAGLTRGQQSLIDATYRDIAETWLASITNASTRTAHELRLRVHVYPTIGDKRIRDIVPSDVTATMRAWSRLAQSTRIAVFGSMSTVFAWALADRVIDTNPCSARTVKRPRKARGDTPDAWPDEWVRAVLASIRPDARLPAVLGAFCGLRQGEAFAATLEDFREANGGRVLLVRRQVKLGHGLAYGPPKHRIEADAPREVPVPDVAWEAIREHVAAHPPLSVTMLWDAGDGAVPEMRTYRLLSSTREGQAWNRNYFNTRIWKPALKEAAVPATRVNGTHALRHWYACKSLEQGVGLARLGEILGHADPAFTLRVYGRFDRSRNADVAMALDAVGRHLLA